MACAARPRGRRRGTGADAGVELAIGFVAIVLAFGLVCLLWPAFRRDVATILSSRELLRRRGSAA